jgi:hypothetical protein
MSKYMLVLQCTRDTLAIAQDEQALDCSNYECTNNELGLPKLCNGATNFQLFGISLVFSLFCTTLFLFLFFNNYFLSLLFLMRPQYVKH